MCARLLCSVVLVGALVPHDAAAQAARFAGHRDYPAGFAPVSIAVADFNRDQVQDLATADSHDNTVSVLLGRGDGTLQSPRPVSLGANAAPRAVTVGDVNRDGKPDLAVANAGANTVSILLGNGDGTFQVSLSVAVGLSPSGVGVGDFNGDGKPDMAVANQSLRHGVGASGQRRWHISAAANGSDRRGPCLRGHRGRQSRRQGGSGRGERRIEYRVALSGQGRWNVASRSDRRGGRDRHLVRRGRRCQCRWRTGPGHG